MNSKGMKVMNKVFLVIWTGMAATGVVAVCCGATWHWATAAISAILAGLTWDEIKKECRV